MSGNTTFPPAPAVQRLSPTEILVAILLAILLVLALARPAGGQSPPVREPGADYLFPSEALAPRVEALQALPSPAFGQGDRVTYTAFNGKAHELTRFQGRYVAILLPDSWMGPAALSQDQIRSFVDRSDLIYRQFMDWMGVEPAGEGPLTVAILPDGETCGWGCGMIGSKGVEIADIGWLNPILWREIAADKGVSVLIHEMTHNFDVFWPYLYYLPGHPHAWTDFVNLYYFVYTREGQVDATPEEVARDWKATTAPYFADRTATWERCVRDGLCESLGITANNAWGGLGFRLALLYGPRSARGFMGFLRTYRQSHTPPPTVEGKNDLYVEALAAGAGRDLGCIANIWHWQVSASLRKRMAQLYGPNADCKDIDGDRVTRLAGDCDERRAAVFPGAVERANGIDDDCDGRTDEALWNEPPAGDFASPRKIALPAEISGLITAGDGTDPFTFRMKAPQRVRIELCSHSDFQGWLFAYDSRGTNLGGQFVGKGQCSRAAWWFGADGWCRFDVTLNSASIPGGYTVEAHGTSPWPAPEWARTAPPGRDGGRLILTASVVSPGGLPSNPTAVRFWVSGLGIVGSVPYAPSVSYAWTPPAGLDLSGLTYRAQLLARGVPLYDFTPAQAFAP
ncbi:MAG TPA: putative metal-binding motif-containing protein [Thermoanaerobaculia bacterium]